MPLSSIRPKTLTTDTHLCLFPARPRMQAGADAVFPVQRARGNSGPTEYNQFARLETETPQLDLWRHHVLLQVILSGGSVDAWNLSSRAFPRDIGMNVALPEVDGRIISRAVSLRRCKLEIQIWKPM